MSDLLTALTGKKIDIKRSISSHIHDLLNTKRGRLHHMPDYGMPEYDATQDFRLAKNHFITALKEVLERYEPRIISLHVEELRSERVDCVLQVRLIAKLVQESFTFAALLLSGGDVYITDENEQ